MKFQTKRFVLHCVLVTFVGVILGGLMAVTSGCKGLGTRTIYAATYIENQPESDANNINGSVGSGIVDNLGRKAEIIGPDTGAQTDGIGGDGKVIRTAGLLNINGNTMAQEKDVSTDAQLLRNIEGSQSSQTPTTAQRQSQGTGGTTTSTLTPTTTVKTLTDNAAQVPIEGSQTQGGLNQGAGTQGDNAGTQTQTPANTAPASTKAASTGAAVSAVQWTCANCANVNPAGTATCTKCNAACPSCTPIP